jgi:glycosyltransferase involved in cell wall biosynthesis
MFARQNNKVLYIEAQSGLRRALAGFRQGDLTLSDLRRPPIRQITENLFVFRYPIWAPTSGLFPLSQFTRMVRRLSLRNALRKLQMSQPIVWFHRPSMVDLINEVPQARLRLYHVVDEYTGYQGQTLAKRRQTKEREKEMMEREKEMMALVDAVIVVSKKLYEAKSPFNPNIYIVPNGVDYKAYTDALSDPWIPEDLQAIKGPRLGYSGFISDYIDLKMLKELAQENPEWSLVFLGEVRVSKQAETWQTLLEMPNVHYLGSVEISQVPYYVKGFDVGLMPYMLNRQVENSCPMKLYDYLAAGLPIASVDIPTVREFSQHVHLANSPRDFGRAVRAALADATPEYRQAQRNVAAQHSWEARLEHISDLIQTQLVAKAQNKKVS